MALSFFHPDCTVGTGISPVRVFLQTRGLYRRLGLTPNPEGTCLVYTILSHQPILETPQEYFIFLWRSTVKKNWSPSVFQRPSTSSGLPSDTGNSRSPTPSHARRLYIH